MLCDHERWHYGDEFSVDGYVHARGPAGFDACSTITSAGIMKMSSVLMGTHANTHRHTHIHALVDFESCSTMTSAGIMKMSSVLMGTSRAKPNQDNGDYFCRGRNADQVVPRVRFASKAMAWQKPTLVFWGVMYARRDLHATFAVRPITR